MVEGEGELVVERKRALRGEVGSLCRSERLHAQARGIRSSVKSWRGCMAALGVVRRWEGGRRRCRGRASPAAVTGCHGEGAMTMSGEENVGRSRGRARVAVGSVMGAVRVVWGLSAAVEGLGMMWVWKSCREQESPEL